MLFSQEKLEQILHSSELTAALSGVEFDRAALCTQAAGRLAPALARYAPEPEGGWLPALYARLTDGLFPDLAYAPPDAQTQRGLSALCSALEALLACEEAPLCCT